MAEGSITILFVSRRNSLRSDLAEKCLAHVAPHKFKAYSCGVPGELAETAHPSALRALAQAKIHPGTVRTRGWDDFARVGAPEVHLVIVLDKDIAPGLPPMRSQPDTAVWPYPDLLAADGPVIDSRALDQLHSLRRRLDIMANLPMRGVDRALLRGDLRDMAYMR